MPIQLHNGAVADNPTSLTDRIRVSVPDLTSADRKTFGPFAFDPIVSGGGGTRLPQRGDKAVIGIDDGTGEQWVVRWHRDDTSVPPYDEEGGSVAWPVGGVPGEVLGFVGPDPDDVDWVAGTPGPQGPAGPVGPIGPQGIQGPTGAKGDTGAQGIQGIQGPQGVKGDTGAQGPQGIQGVKGDKGDTGATGPMGTVYDSDQISTIKTYAGKVIPTNWMLCDGRQLNRIDYSQLADAMGVPAAQATFFIPDLRNKFIYGASDPAVQLATGGEVNHTLTNAEMPYHSHGGATSGRDRSQNHQHTPDGGGYFAQYLGGGGVIYYNGTGEARPGSSVTGFTDPADHLHYIGADGGSAAHNNMPPYIVLAYIIKVAGTSINAGGALVGPMGPPGVLSDPGYRWMGSTAPLAAGPAAGTAWTYNVAGAPYLDLTPGKWRVAASSMVYGNTPDYVYMSIWNETDGFYYPESLGDGHYVNGATAPYAQVRCGTIINVTKNIRVRLRVHPNGGSIQTIPAAGNAPVARMEAWIEGPGPKGDTGAAGGALNPPPAWITPPLTSGSHYGAPYGPVQYRKWDDIGLVEVRGLWQPAAGSSDIFTLPVGARPTGGYVLIFSGTNSSYTGTDLRVYSTGFIQQQVGAPVGGWVSLSQIRFFVN